jgi:hypothetical protein
MATTQDIAFLESFALGQVRLTHYPPILPRPFPPPISSSGPFPPPPPPFPAQDRAAVLKNLVPGTADHFTYVTLLAEQTGYPADLQPSIDAFVSGSGENHPLVRSYLARRALVSYKEGAAAGSPEDAASTKALSLLRQTLGLNPNYSRPHGAPPPVTDDEAAADAARAAAAGPKGPSAIPASDLALMGSEDKIVTLLADLYGQRLPQFLNPSTFPLDTPAVLARLESGGDDQLLVQSLLTFGGFGGGLPATESAIDLVAGALTCKLTRDSHWEDAILRAVLPSMTLPQVEALADRLKDLRHTDTFVGAVLSRSAPPGTVDFRTDFRALRAYLDRLAALVEPLPATYNSLRLLVLHHQLKALRSDPERDGRLDSPEAKNLLERYVALPRPHYREQIPALTGASREAIDRGGHWAQPGAGGAAIGAVALPMPGHQEDEELVRSALTDVFSTTDSDSLAPWNKYVPEHVLKTIQATAKLAYGPERERERAADWAKTLPGGMEELKRLGETVLLEFTERCTEYYPSPTAAVTLHVRAKNVPRITVSLYEVNTTSYYRSTSSEITTDIQLDGLTPFSSSTHDFAPAGDAARLSPLRIHTVSIPVPDIDTTGAACGGRGVWIVEVVGAGRSSRAVIRRGALRFVERKTVAGHLITVLDEKNAPLPRDRVSVFMAGRRYVPTGADAASAAPAASAASSEILIPYGSGSSRQPLILTLASSSSAAAAPAPAAAPAAASPSSDPAWSFSTLESLQHEAEQYSLSAAFAVEREGLIKDNYAATLLIRPKLHLSCGGLVPVPLKALDHVSLTITAVDAEGATSQRVQRNFPLAYDRETSVPFAVPANVRQLSFDLTGSVEVMATGGKQTLTASHAVSVNGIDTTRETRDAFLRYTTNEGYAVHILGKTGEPVAGLQVQVDLTHALVQDRGDSHSTRSPFRHNLVTDADGKVVLGQLTGFTSVRIGGAWASGGGGHSTAAFDIPRDVTAYPTTIHCVSSNSAAAATAAAAGAARSGSWFRSLLGGPRAPPLSALAVPAPPADADVQARIPFRPSVAPVPGAGPYVLTRRDFRLVEMRDLPRGGASPHWTGREVGVGPLVPVADMFAHASYDSASGFIVVRGLPPGHFVAQVKRPTVDATTPSPEVVIRVLPAATTTVVAGRLACDNTLLQARAGVTSPAAAAASCPVHIASISVNHPGQYVAVHVTGGLGSNGGPASSSDVRLHLVATHFVPVWDAGAALAGLPIPGLAMEQFGPVRSRYLNGRTLGEETMYILDRKERMRGAGALPGNLLPRPSLLLNPWSLGPVATDVQEARGGTEHARYADNMGGAAFVGAAAMFRRGGGGGAGATQHAAYVTLDFLGRPATVLANLTPDPRTGLVLVPLHSLLGLPESSTPEARAAALAAAREVFVTLVAADAVTTDGCSSSIQLVPAATPISEGASPFRDLTRAASALDPSSHLVQRSRISVLGRPGATVDMAAAASYTKAEVYTSLDRAAGLLASLSGSAALQAEWLSGPLLAWPALSPAEKRARYSKFACHELHTFLFFRDAAFFADTVAPFLQGKRSKGLLDHWLLAASAAQDTAPGSPASATAGAHWAGLRAYARPQVFARLNPFEQALLAAALSPEEAKGVARFLRDWAEANPIQSDVRDRVFKSAIASNALEASGQELQSMLEATENERQANSRSLRAAAVADAAPPQPAPGGRGMMKKAMARAMPDMPMQAMARSMAAPAPPMMARGGRMAAPPMAAPAMAMMMSAPMAAAPPMPMMAAAAAPRMMMMMADDAPSAEVQDDYAEADQFQDEGDMALREQARGQPLFRPLDKTEEYAETHYWRVRKSSDADTRNLVGPSAFWADFADHVAAVVADVHAALGPADAAVPARVAAAVAAGLRGRPFASANFPLSAATNSGSGPNGALNDMLLTLAVLGLPLERSPVSPPERPRVSLTPDAARLVYTAGATAAVLFHQDIDVVPAPGSASSSVLCGQQYIDPDDANAYVRGQQVTKFLPAAPGDGAFELQAGKVYHAHIVVSNISSAQQTLEVFTHIPGGSLPANNGSMVTTRSLTLEAYSTTHFAYPFYMPRNGTFAHFPVHVSSTDGELLAFAQPATLRVVERPTTRDTTSWRYVAANAPDAAILEYLATANRLQTDLSQLLWRLQGSKPFHAAVLGLLRTRQWWHAETWGLCFHHNDVAGMREYLAREDLVHPLRSLIGTAPVFTSSLVSVSGEEGIGRVGTDPADATSVLYARGIIGGGNDPNCGVAYEHLEYSPLVNARAHQLGVKRRILNKAVERQYRTLLHVLSCKPREAVNAADLLAVTYHLLLQDRIDEAQTTFAKVPVPEGSVAARVPGGAAGPAAHVLDAAAGSQAGGSPSWSILAYDYMAAYLDFFRADGLYTLPVASAVARAYASHPVPKWAAKFREIAAQLAEAGVGVGAEGEGDGEGFADASERLTGAAAGTLAGLDSASEMGVAKELSRESVQSAAVSREPSLEVSVEGSSILVSYSNLHPASAAGAAGASAPATLRLFTMDLELLFSTSPFMAAAAGSGTAAGAGASAGTPKPSSSSSSSSPATGGLFSFVRPNGVVSLALPYAAPGRLGEARFPLPAAFEGANVMVEVAAAGLRRSTPFYSTKLAVTVSEPYGRLRVTDAKSGKPLPRTYVKVYYTEATEGASGKFYKDGYTDARGAFDYTSLSTDELSRTKRFGLLVSSETHGAVVRVASPPGTR